MPLVCCFPLHCVQIRATQLGFKVKDSEPARRAALADVVGPLAKNLRAELAGSAACKSVEDFIRSWFNKALNAAYPRDKQLDQLEWAGMWGGMVTCVKSTADSIILCLTSHLRDMSGEYHSPILATMMRALRKDEKLPVKSSRFGFLHADLIEIATDSLKAMRPELQGKAAAYITALHLKTMTAPEALPGQYLSTCKSSLALLTAFNKHITDALVQVMAVDFQAATNNLLVNVYESKDKVRYVLDYHITIAISLQSSLLEGFERRFFFTDVSCPLSSPPPHSQVTALLNASKTGLARLLQEDAASAAERAKLGSAMAGLRAAMVSIANAVGIALDPVEDAPADDEPPVVEDALDAVD